MKTSLKKLQAVQPGSVLELKSDDNGTKFTQGFVFVYKNTGVPGPKLTLGRVTTLGQIEKTIVAVSELKNVVIVQTPAQATNLEGQKPKRLKAGDILYATPNAAYGTAEQQSDTSVFMFVEQISGLRTHTLHIVTQGQLGGVQKRMVHADKLENFAVLS